MASDDASLATLPDSSSNSPLPAAASAAVKRLVEEQFDRRAPSYDAGNTYHPPLAEKLLRIAALRPGWVWSDGIWLGFSEVGWKPVMPRIVVSPG